MSCKLCSLDQRREVCITQKYLRLGASEKLTQVSVKHERRYFAEFQQ